MKMRPYIVYFSVTWFCTISGTDLGHWCTTPWPVYVLPICSSANMTGSIIPIDTRRVPQNETVVCHCSVDIDVDAKSIEIEYEVFRYYPSCALRFQAGKALFSCTSVPLLTIETFNVLRFSKDHNTAHACFVLFIDRKLQNTSKATATVRCYAKNESLTTKSVTSPTTLYTTKSTVRRSTSNTPDITTADDIMMSSDVQTTTPVRCVDIPTGFSETQTRNENQNLKSVIVGAAFGGAAGGAGITILVVLVIIFYRRKTPTYEAVHRTKTPEHVYTVAKHSSDVEMSSRPVTNDSKDYENL